MPANTATEAPSAPRHITIEAPGPQGPLQGTLLQPAQPQPAPTVLIIPGSGPTDRDGNNPMGVAAATYRLLAEGLAGRGIASVRIDKRGMFGSKAAVPDANAVTLADYADDIAVWARAIRERTGTPCVWLLGHSEGGLVALAAARRSASVGEPAICGLILVATPGRPLGDVLRAQLEGQLQGSPLYAMMLEEARRAIAELEAGRRIDTAAMSPLLLPLFAEPVQGYLIDLMAHDPARLMAAYPGRALILQPELDLQVSEADADLLKAAARRATLALVPGANHVLKSASPFDAAANIATYTDPDLPLAPGTVEAIAAFIQADTASEQP